MANLSNPRGDVANKRGFVTDPLDDMKPKDIGNGGANFVRSTNSPGRATPTAPGDGIARVGANNKGTGKRGVPTAMALSGKRKLGLKMPADF